MNKYIPTQEIGKGGYGTVFKAKHYQDDTIVAIKRIQMSENEEGIKNSTLREVAISKSNNHPNLVKLIEMIPDIKENVVYCVYEFMPMDLRAYIRQNPGIKENTARTIIRQVLQGLDQLHKMDIIHRDMKPHNVLIDPSTLQVKIIDFGLAREFTLQPVPLSCSCGTKFFLAPELMLGQSKYTKTSDIWGVGLILSQLFSNKYIFPCRENEEGLQKIFSIMGSPKGELLQKFRECPRWTQDYEGQPGTGFDEFMPGASKNAIDLFVHLIDLDWESRYTAEQALKHKWFDEIVE
ncbi:Kinase [Hexamita inflata]|uniref:cyclin-dependent kinase n=1 Tax=Hexamita inflata TaxID=28002 RepID=A0AA86QSC9_9EUKA|nr:CMGC CDK [Hexamita inflata]